MTKPPRSMFAFQNRCPRAQPKKQSSRRLCLEETGGRVRAGRKSKELSILLEFNCSTFGKLYTFAFADKVVNIYTVDGRNPAPIGMNTGIAHPQIDLGFESLLNHKTTNHPTSWREAEYFVAAFSGRGGVGGHGEVRG